MHTGGFISSSTDKFSLMSWKDFEDYVIQLLASFYSKEGLAVYKTPYQNDGGKDGYGSLIIKPALDNDDLDITVNIWAEVKKRSGSSVDIDDIGGHLILALDQRINKLIFITNSYFTERAERLCQSAGHRLNMGVTFIDGDRLKDLDGMRADDLARAFAETDTSGRPLIQPRKRAAATKLDIRCAFISDPNGTLADGNVDLQIDVGEIAYWVCEVVGASDAGTVDLDVIAPEKSLLTCIPVSSPGLRIDSMEVRQRVIFAVWSLHAGEFEPGHLRVDAVVAVGAAEPTVVVASGKLKIRAPILAPTIPAASQRIIDAATQERERILGEGGLSCLLIEAIAGAGKSFLLRNLIHGFIAAGFTQMHLDGANETSIHKVVQSVLRQAVPLPPEFIQTMNTDALEAWLRKAGHDEQSELVSALPALMEGSGEQGGQAVVELVASVLINASAVNPVLLTFEDLHKTSSSVLDFLNRLSGVLAFRRRGRVMMVLTTRPMRTDQPEVIHMASSQDRGSAASRFIFSRLSSPSFAEARSMLIASLRGLATAEADMITGRVGTNPFALREALQFLRTDSTISQSPDGLFFLADPAGIHRAAQAQALVSATRYRLRWLADRIGGWFDRFILAGACLGRQFTIAHALNDSGAVADADLHRAIDLCIDYDVLKPVRVRAPDQEADFAFDHDLVRITTLLEAGEKRISRVAERLLSYLPLSPIDRRRALLAYLANDAETCMAAAGGLLREAQVHKNSGEAVLYAFMRTAVMIATDGYGDKTAFLRPLLEEIDDALITVPVPELPSRPLPSAMIQNLRDVLGEMEHVGSLASEVGARLVTIAQMHAAYAGDNAALSEFRYYEGRRLFGMTRYKDAYDIFLDAEQISPGGRASREPMLARIRLRQAICERHLGHLEIARRTMGRALSLRAGPDWKLFESVAANLGAFYMYGDQTLASSYWNKGLRVARLTGDVGQEAHFLNDLAHVRIMERHYVGALQLADDAEALIRKYGLHKEQLRTDLLRACVFLASGRLAPAHYALARAEDVALAHGDLRRLWRVRANLATLAELTSDPESTIVHELQAIAHMPIRTEFDLGRSGTIGGRGNRVTGALINIYLRSLKAPDRYKAVQEQIGSQTWNAIGALVVELENSKNVNRFSGGIGCLYQPVGEGLIMRFLITE